MAANGIRRVSLLTPILPCFPAFASKTPFRANRVQRATLPRDNTAPESARCLAQKQPSHEFTLVGAGDICYGLYNMNLGNLRTARSVLHRIRVAEKTQNLRISFGAESV